MQINLFSTLHQLRGRVGRGEKQGTCILLFKEGLSKMQLKELKPKSLR